MKGRYVWGLGSDADGMVWARLSLSGVALVLERSVPATTAGLLLRAVPVQQVACQASRPAEVAMCGCHISARRH